MLSKRILSIVIALIMLATTPIAVFAADPEPTLSDMKTLADDASKMANEAKRLKDEIENDLKDDVNDAHDKADGAKQKVEEMGEDGSDLKKALDAADAAIENVDKAPDAGKQTAIDNAVPKVNEAIDEVNKALTEAEKALLGAVEAKAAADNAASKAAEAVGKANDAQEKAKEIEEYYNEQLEKALAGDNAAQNALRKLESEVSDAWNEYAALQEAANLAAQNAALAGKECVEAQTKTAAEVKTAIDAARDAQKLADDVLDAWRKAEANLKAGLSGDMATLAGYREDGREAVVTAYQNAAEAMLSATEILLKAYDTFGIAKETRDKALKFKSDLKDVILILEDRDGKEASTGQKTPLTKDEVDKLTDFSAKTAEKVESGTAYSTTLNIISGFQYHLPQAPAGYRPVRSNEVIFMVGDGTSITTGYYDSLTGNLSGLNINDQSYIFRDANGEIVPILPNETGFTGVQFIIGVTYWKQDWTDSITLYYLVTATAGNKRMDVTGMELLQKDVTERLNVKGFGKFKDLEDLERISAELEEWNGTAYELNNEIFNGSTYAPVSAPDTTPDTTPRRRTTTTTTTTPTTTTIADAPVPLAEAPTTTIGDNAVPLTDTVTILDENVPLADLPRSGGALSLVASNLVTVEMALPPLRKKRKLFIVRPSNAS